MKCLSLIFIGILSTVLCNGQTITLNPIKDNSIYSENSNRSNGQGRLFSGRNCNSDSRRALVKFDLSAIPINAVITSASLNVTVDNFSEDGLAENFNLYALTAEFGEGASNGGGQGATAISPDATWNDAMLGSVAWMQSGGDFNNTILTSVIMPTANGSRTFPSTSNFTDVIQNWVNNPTSNFGMIIIGNESNSCSARRFGSKDAGTAPELVISYSLLDDASFTYPSESFCANDLDPSPNISGETGGSFSSTTGLIINSTSGVIDVSASTPGPYIITYTTSSPGENSSTFSITINPQADASFSYSAMEFCIMNSTIEPVIIGLSGGTFTSEPTGLNINSNSGVINLSTSLPGQYNITYQTNGNCPSDQTVAINIIAFATDFNGDGTTDGDDFSTFLGNFGFVCPGIECNTDLDGDGVTDGDDFSIFLGNYGLTCN